MLYLFVCFILLFIYVLGETSFQDIHVTPGLAVSSRAVAEEMPSQEGRGACVWETGVARPARWLWDSGTEAKGVTRPDFRALSRAWASDRACPHGPPPTGAHEEALRPLPAPSPRPGFLCPHSRLTPHLRSDARRPVRHAPPKPVVARVRTSALPMDGGPRQK